MGFATWWLGTAGSVKAFLWPKSDSIRQPMPWEELTAYAQRGAWAREGRSPARGFYAIFVYTVGGWFYLRARLTDFLFQRVGRAVAFFIVAQLILRGTGAIGHGIGEAIRSYYHALAWIFGI